MHTTLNGDYGKKIIIENSLQVNLQEETIGINESKVELQKKSNFALSHVEIAFRPLDQCFPKTAPGTSDTY